MIVVSVKEAPVVKQIKPIRCPKCGCKRICDVSSGSSPRNLKPNESFLAADSILLKCPRCHTPVILTIQ